MGLDNLIKGYGLDASTVKRNLTQVAVVGVALVLVYAAKYVIDSYNHKPPAANQQHVEKEHK